MIRSILSIAILCLFLGTLYSQDAEEETVRLKKLMSSEVSGVEKPGQSQGTKYEEQKKGRMNVSVGTSFTHMGAYGSYMGFYAAPTYTLSLSPRWSLHTGILASSYTPLNMPGNPENGFSHPVFNSLAVYAAASYRMNERLVIHGAGVKQISQHPAPPLMAYPSDNLSLGATYRIGDNITIGASIHMNRQQGLYPASPFGGPSHFANPYGW